MVSFGKHSKGMNVVHTGKHSVLTKEQPSITLVVSAVALALLLALSLVVIPAMVACSQGSTYTRAYANPEFSAIARQVRSASALNVERAAFPETEDVTPQAESAAMPTVDADYTSHVGEQLQNLIMYGGCELISLNIALQSMGFDTDIEQIVDDFLEIDGNFATGYAGSPYDYGGGFPPGVAAAANGYLESIGATVRAHNLTGLAFEDLAALVNRGYPVMVWSTMELEEPYFSGEYEGDSEWYINEHCVVLYGFDGDYALVSDPLDGYVERDLQWFADVYEQCGSMAIAIF